MSKLVNFVTEAYEELKKTRWPNKQEVIRLTMTVIATSLGVGLFVTLFDFVFKELLTLLLNR